MQLILKNGLAKIGALVFLTGLSACAMDSSYMLQNQSAEAVANAELMPIVTTITPELVRAQREQRERQVGQDLKDLIGKATPYKIEAGDILSIVVWGHPELAAAVMNAQATMIAGADVPGGAAPPSGFVVDHEGMLQFPYAGALKISGLTEEQARNLLTTKIAFYINKPNVTLRVQAYRSKRIYIDGEVKAPGLQPINDIPMTLVEALNRAGGVLPTADQSQISVMRDGKTYLINLPQIMRNRIDPATIMLRHGDVVRVLSHDESKVFVAGEVTEPKSLTMHNGRLTLNEALGESGGINPVSGDARQVYVVRKAEKEPIVYRLDAKSPGALAIAENFELNPKDLVYVSPTALMNWHRTISLLLPEALSSAVGSKK
ncbi:MAG: polysaccharide biosynthesis/export family protein [Pseudomonadota bacterium]